MHGCFGGLGGGAPSPLASLRGAWRPPDLRRSSRTRPRPPGAAASSLQLRVLPGSATGGPPPRTNLPALLLTPARPPGAAGILICAFILSVSVLLQVLGCALFPCGEKAPNFHEGHKGCWWPMLSCLTYVFAPMPYLFFTSDSFDSYGGEGGSAVWQDVGNFMGGMAGTWSLALPAILLHAKVIVLETFLLFLGSAAVFGVAIAAHMYLSSDRIGMYRYL